MSVVLPEAAAAPTRLARNPWLLLNCANLDAPCVAVLWQIFFARALHTSVSLAAVVSLGLAVWLIYAVDRLLDVTPGAPQPNTERHEFHWRNRKVLLICVVIAAAILISTSALLSPTVVRDGLLLSATVTVYGAIVHLLPCRTRIWFPKELLVGVLFAVGTCLAPWCRSGERPAIFLPGLFFAALCSLNCVAIEVWERRRSSGNDSTALHPITLWMSRRLHHLLWIISIFAALVTCIAGTPSLYGAILLAALAFLLLDHYKGHFSSALLRVLADAPLLSPLLFLLTLR